MDLTKLVQIVRLNKGCPSKNFDLENQLFKTSRGTFQIKIDFHSPEHPQGYSTGCPKKMVIRKGFEFLTLGGVFLGGKK